jgi:hypothetical protein
MNTTDKRETFITFSNLDALRRYLDAGKSVANIFRVDSEVFSLKISTPHQWVYSDEEESITLVIKSGPQGDFEVSWYEEL